MRDKPLLSLIVPVAPGREARLRSLLSRLTLNKRLFPDHTFEVIVCDGGSSDNTSGLCETIAQLIPLKYIYVPIKRFVNPAYPRNIMMRVAEGKVIGMLDVDHWPSEHLIYGMLNPFVDDSKFNIVQITKAGDRKLPLKEAFQENPSLVFGQCIEGVQNVINRGYVVDSSRSSIGVDPQKVVDELLMQQNAGLQIHNVFHHGAIPHGINNTLWVWSALRQPVMALNGYDEIYCRKFSHAREDDDWRERLKAQITGLKNFVPTHGFFDGQNFNFCAIHLWHDNSWTGIEEAGNLNKMYYSSVCQPVKEIVRNKDWQWGKLMEYSFSIIDGVSREPKQHEQWIAENIHDVPNYVDDPQWKDIDGFIQELESYIGAHNES